MTLLNVNVQLICSLITSKMSFKVCKIFSILALSALTAGHPTQCPANWYNLGSDGCFYFANEAPVMSWGDALDFCHRLNHHAYLAEVKDAVTNARLAELSGPDMNWWLGATDIQGGQWRWMRNGQRVSFFNWHTDEPNNMDGREHCLQLYANQQNGIRAGAWNDLSCAKKIKPLCQLF